MLQRQSRSKRDESHPAFLFCCYGRQKTFMNKAEGVTHIALASRRFLIVEICQMSDWS